MIRVRRSRRDRVLGNTAGLDGGIRLHQAQQLVDLCGSEPCRVW